MPDAGTDTVIETDSRSVLDAETSLLNAAREATGLSDWGADQTFRIGLRKKIEDMLQLPPSQQDALRSTLINALGIRLQVIEDGRRNPDILRAGIDRPLFIFGLPRSGTTYLHSLLSLDPEARSATVWESMHPSPPTDAATFADDPRIAQTRAELQALDEIAPGFLDKHPMTPEDPTECEAFTIYHFNTIAIWASFPMPRYAEWIRSGASDGLFEWHRRMLQQYQWKGPRGRWTLKSPNHIFTLPALLAVYPDARLVQTHRDPLHTLPSNASLVHTMRVAMDPAADPTETGRDVLAMMADGIDLSLAARADPAVDRRILDIAYRDTVDDPIGTVRRIHQHFGLPFTAAHRRNIEAKVEQDAASRTEAHRYTPEEYGMSAGEITARFEDYRRKFAQFLG
jgi:hypothetical protein